MQAASNPRESYSVDPTTGQARAMGLSDEHRLYAAWIHFVCLVGWIPVIATSGGAFMVPALCATAMWLIKKNESPFIDDHGREAINFQLSVLLLGILLVPLSIVTCGLAAVLYIVLPVLALVGAVLAGLAALRSAYFRYPVCIRMVPPPSRR
jgi:hypothetical protein